jgi:hypothetical protein
MSTIIAGDGRTFAGHLLHLSFKEVFNHDIPKLLNLGETEAEALQKGWEKLGPEVQDSLLHASGIINEITSDLSKAPQDVIDSVLAKFTDIKVEDLNQWLAKVSGIFTGAAINVNQDGAQSVLNLQNYFKQFEGNKLSGILSWFAQALATIIKPDNVIAQVTTYMETAYQFIKALFNK